VIPIADFHSNRREKIKPYVVWGLIGLCVLVFLYQLMLSGDNSLYFTYRYGAVPIEVVGGSLPTGFPTAPFWPPLTLLTSIFLHGDWTHIIFNMLYLWVFGDNIENVFGHTGFLLFYLAGGIVAGLMHVAFSLGPQAGLVPIIGASGAIAAVMGAYLALFPNARIVTFIFYMPVPISAFWYLIIWLGMQFLGVLGGDTGIAWWAHIGGFLFGYLVAFVFLKIRYPNAPPPWRQIKVGNRRPGTFYIRKPQGKGSQTGFSDDDENNSNGDGRTDSRPGIDPDIWKR